jgi:hypothetical protein
MKEVHAAAHRVATRPSNGPILFARIGMAADKSAFSFSPRPSSMYASVSFAQLVWEMIAFGNLRRRRLTE